MLNSMTINSKTGQYVLIMKISSLSSQNGFVFVCFVIIILPITDFDNYLKFAARIILNDNF